MPIATIETEFAAPPNVEDADPAHPSTWWPAIALASLRQARPYLNHPVMPEAQGIGNTVDAYINHGRWVVDCPSCPSAQNVTPDDPRFWCPTCGSGDVWHRVVFPKDRPAVEAALEARPLPQQQNWRPGETVADLRRENRDNGIRDDD